jgi:hypothetical protein
MKQIFTSIFLISLAFPSSGQVQAKRSFENLSTLVIGKLYDGVTELISYDKSISEVINKKYSDLDKSDPFYSGECDGDYIKLIRTRIDKNSNEYYIISYNLSCCCNYGFTIYKDKDPDKIIGIIMSTKILIPGNGNIYSEDRIFQNFNKRQKFVLENDTIREIEQPFNYVGIKSKALRTIKIYAFKDLTEHIATVPPQYKIEVLLNDKKIKDLYLVRTSFGIVGWTRLESAVAKSKDIEGIYYWGD